MPTRPLTDLDRELRNDPEYEAALEELAPYEEIARQLIAFRTEHGLSQAELARRCGVSQPAIARLERGEHEPRLATLRRVAPASGGSISQRCDCRERRGGLRPPSPGVHPPHPRGRDRGARERARGPPGTARRLRAAQLATL